MLVIGALVVTTLGNSICFSNSKNCLFVIVLELDDVVRINVLRF